jgi:hypothetical protein
MNVSITEAWTRPARRGPVEGENVIGVDAELSARPGVPMNAWPARAENAPERAPAEQGDSETRARHLRREALDGPTPVFGTAQPPHGVSGALRRGAYRIPEHRARHWLLLLLADRMDVVEDRVGGALSAPIRLIGARRTAERIRSHPLPLFGAALVGALVANRLLR